MPLDIWWYDGRKQWCADVPTRIGRKRLYLGKNESRARAELHRYLAAYYEDLEGEAREEKPVLRRRSDDPPLLELSVKFLNWNENNRAAATSRTYKDSIRHVTKRYSDRLCSELTPQALEELKAAMIQHGYAAGTINRVVRSAKRMFSWGVKQGIVKENPLRGVERVSQHVNAPEHPGDKHMPLERALKCIEICGKSPPLGDLSELLLLTGMRIGEAVRVTWADVDLEQRMIRLKRHKTSSWGNYRPRTIPLCDRAVEVLEKQATDGERTGPVFRGRSKQPLTVSSAHCRLQRLRKKNSELGSFSFHKLRHTCATNLARMHVPERVAQAILGHSSTLMTRYYTATGQDEMIDAVQRLAAHVSS
jgi:integrase